jgi:hypothetical protein
MSRRLIPPSIADDDVVGIAAGLDDGLTGRELELARRPSGRLLSAGRR